MKKMNDHQIQFTLAAGNADFPFLLSDYHILMYPAGMIDEAIAKGIGTGLYKVLALIQACAACSRVWTAIIKMAVPVGLTRLNVSRSMIPLRG